MKKLIFSLCILGLVNFTSCEKTNENPESSTQDTAIANEEIIENDQTSSESYLGTWITNGFKMDGAQTVDMGETPQMIEFSAEALDGTQNSKLMLHKDNTYTAENNGFKLKVATKMNGTLLHEQIVDAGSTFQDKGKWSKNGNQMSFTVDGEEVLYTIEKLTSTEMVLVADRATMDLSEEEMPEEMEFQTKISFKR